MAKDSSDVDAGNARAVAETEPAGLTNKPDELSLLRRVASAAKWAIDANGDHPIKKDGRSRAGVNWVMAQGQLNRALQALRAYYPTQDYFVQEKEYAASVERQFNPKWKPKDSAALDSQSRGSAETEGSEPPASTQNESSTGD